MKFILTPLLLIVSGLAFSQTDISEMKKDTKEFQTEINSEYGNKEESPLTEEDFEHFNGLPFFDFDSNYYVTATIKKAKKKKSIKFKTSTDRKPVYDIYGTVTFEIHGNSYSLNVYQSQSLREKEEYSDYLFLPFMDLTNGKTSYAGGRYIDLKIPKTNEITINFHKAYNPYCAYSGRYSCPVVPEVNFIEVEINAGVKAPKPH